MGRVPPSPPKARAMRNTRPLPDPPPPPEETKQFCDYCGSRFDASLDICPNCGASVNREAPVQKSRKKPTPAPASSGGTPSRCGPPPPPHGGGKIRV